jgi:hypothetical protein
MLQAILGLNSPAAPAHSNGTAKHCMIFPFKSYYFGSAGPACTSRGKSAQIRPLVMRFSLFGMRCNFFGLIISSF